MNEVAKSNEKTLAKSMQDLRRLQNKVKDGSEQRELVDKLESSLKEMENLNKKFFSEIDNRKEDEKSFKETQDQRRAAIEKNIDDNQKYANEMADIGQTGGASKQFVAKTQTQYSNLLIDMENAFGGENEQSSRFKNQN